MLIRFGDYELLEEIARGGLGVVYRARQVSLHRTVALKMILSGQFAGEAEVQRFRIEAKAAAGLQHPNIVAIHEVGQFEGQPFYSMDFVAGRTLEEVVRDGPLPARRAAKYLQALAEAVAYAHQHGILHRDLKPSNVLVDANDQPRIADFGLAKHLNDAHLSTLNLQLTLTGQLLGSPNFMSPEQAAGGHGAVGPGSDVYSLGAVLYHLITGRPPFVAETMTATLRLVTETEPMSPRLLVPTVPRDLETICLKCLEKEPQRRYATAQELAEDLNHFLRDEPIHARPIGPTARLWRWCRRNRALASTGAAVLVLLLTVAIGSPVALVHINRERVRAEEMRKQAEANAERARAEAVKSQQVAQFLQDMLANASPWVALGRDKTLLREIVDTTAERVGKDLKDQPDVEAALRNTLGHVYWALGEYEKAEAMHRKALAMRKRLLGDEHPDVAQSLGGLASVLRSQGRFDEAETVIRDALAMRRKLLGNKDSSVAHSLLSLALVLRRAGKLEEAERMHREQLELQRARLPPNAPEIGTALASFTYTLLLDKKFTEAEPLARELLAIDQRIVPDGWGVFSTQSMLGGALLGQKRYGEAEPLLLSGYKGLKQREDTIPPAYRPPVLEALERLVELYQGWGKPDQAAEWRKTLAEFNKAEAEKKVIVP